MDINTTVAQNVKRIREGKKLTLETAAQLTGVSRSMLAQIEKGDVNPTISILWRIAAGYKVSFSQLIDRHSDAAVVIPAGSIKTLVEDEGRFINSPIFPFEDGAGFEIYRIEIRADGSLAAEPHMAGTEEYITVFAGEIEIGAGDAVFRLRTFDSVRFKGDVPHYYRNIGEGTAQLSMLIRYTQQ